MNGSSPKIYSLVSCAGTGARASSLDDFGRGCIARFASALVRLHDVDRGSVQRCLDVRRVVFLDHLHTRAAVLSDLVDVGALHQA